jgi:hypothetical protein
LLPTIYALAGSAEVEIFSKSEFAPLVRRPLVVSALERFEINRLFVAGGGRDPRVRAIFESFAAIYSWTGNGSAVFAAELEAAAPGRGRIMAFCAPKAGTHQAEYYLSCCGLLPDSAPAYEIPLAPHALAWRAEFLKRHALEETPLLLMAPGSGAREKNWPVAHFSAMGRWWRARTAGEVIVLLGPVERERGGFEALAGEFIAAADLDLAQAAALLARSDLYLGNDSGITHLAAAVGALTAAIFGPSDARQWAPRGAKVMLFDLLVQCAPCAIPIMKACPHRSCLTEFSPAQIIAQLENINEVATLTRGGSRITVQPL